MKYFLLLLFIAFGPLAAFAQNNNPEEPVTDTVTYSSNPDDSLCNYVFKTEGCSPGALYANAENGTWNNYNELVVSSWSYNAGSCPTGHTRTMVNFNGMNTIPQNAVINKAELRMYGWSNPTMAITVGNSFYPGSPYNSWGSNEMLVKRITQPWKTGTVTWNTQPATGNLFVVTRPSAKQYEDDIIIDVTTLVQDMVNNNQFYGFMFMMQKEQLYRSFGFYSCLSEKANKRPQLEVAYTTVKSPIGATDPNNPTVYTTPPTSITDVIVANSVKLYPQPAHDKMTVQYIALQNDNVSYCVYDMKGSKMLEGQVYAEAGVNNIRVNVNDLPQGVYMLSLSSANNSVKTRFAKF